MVSASNIPSNFRWQPMDARKNFVCKHINHLM